MFGRAYESKPLASVGRRDIPDPRDRTIDGLQPVAACKRIRSEGLANVNLWGTVYIGFARFTCYNLFQSILRSSLLFLDSYLQGDSPIQKQLTGIGP